MTSRHLAIHSITVLPSKFRGGMITRGWAGCPEGTRSFALKPSRFKTPTIQLKRKKLLHICNRQMGVGHLRTQNLRLDTSITLSKRADHKIREVRETAHGVSISMWYIKCCDDSWTLNFTWNWIAFVFSFGFKDFWGCQTNTRRQNYRVFSVKWYNWRPMRLERIER